MKDILLLILLALGSVAHAELSYRDPVATEIVRDAPVVYVGEGHFDTSSKEFMLWLLPQIKSLGFTHLAIEMMNASSQSALDSFLQNTDAEVAALETLRHALERDWNYPNAGYLAVFAEAKHLGLKIVALDGRDQIAEMTDVSLEALHEYVYQRDEFMSDRLGQTLKKSPGARAIVWTGALHSIRSQDAPFTRPTQSTLLESKFGISSLSYVVDQFLPGDRPQALLAQRGLARPCSGYFLAEHLFSGDRRQNVVVYSERSTLGWDGVVLWHSIKMEPLVAGAEGAKTNVF